MKPLPTLLLAALAVAAPASARRHSTRYHAPRRRAAMRLPALGEAVPTATTVARNVIVFVADGYAETDWEVARAARHGYLALDRLTAVGLALPPFGEGGAASFAQALGTGATAMTSGAEPSSATWPELAKQRGKTLALVSGAYPLSGPLRDVLLRHNAGALEDNEPMPELSDVRLYRSSRPGDEEASRLISDPNAILNAETVPFAAVAPKGTLTFDTLFFRGLHLAAKNPKGFAMVVTGGPENLAAGEFDASVAAAVRYAQHDGRTLVLVERWGMGMPILVEAAGAGADKFTGTLEATDVPKVIAGLAHLPGFRHDFSALYAARTTPPLRTAQNVGPANRMRLPW